MSLSARPTLVTGFEPFDGLDLNPSAEIAKRLDGSTVGGAPVVGRVLPVSLKNLDGALRAVLDDVRPGCVIALGLAQGESTIRVERVGLNVADFEIADNDGEMAVGRAIEPNGPDARFATVPVAEMTDAVLAAGIPAHVSNTAGAYLCNACLYRLVGLAGEVPAGFIHLPYLPEQVAALMASDRRERAMLPSMDLATMQKAVEIAIAVSMDPDVGGP
jgi:pyroglutamyl-peptidase